jgi:hypothetical protein
LGRGSVHATFELDVVSLVNVLHTYTSTNNHSHDCPQLDSKGLALVDTLDVNFEGKEQLGGWTGGRVVLVPTDKPVEQWQPIAERVL